MIFLLKSVFCKNICDFKIATREQYLVDIVIVERKKCPILSVLIQKSFHTADDPFPHRSKSVLGKPSVINCVAHYLNFLHIPCYIYHSEQCFQI